MEKADAFVPAALLHGLDHQRHNALVGGLNIGEVMEGLLLNLCFWMKNGLLDLGFRKTHYSVIPPLRPHFWVASFGHKRKGALPVANPDSNDYPPSLVLMSHACDETSMEPDGAWRSWTLLLDYIEKPVDVFSRPKMSYPPPAKPTATSVGLKVRESTPNYGPSNPEVFCKSVHVHRVAQSVFLAAIPHNQGDNLHIRSIFVENRTKRHACCG